MKANGRLLTKFITILAIGIAAAVFSKPAPAAATDCGAICPYEGQSLFWYCAPEFDGTWCTYYDGHWYFSSGGSCF